MRYYIDIRVSDTIFRYDLLPYGNSQRIDCDGIVIFDIWKVHNHHYQLQAFFYKSKVIISYGRFGSKKELYGAIQNLLQEYL